MHMCVCVCVYGVVRVYVCVHPRTIELLLSPLFTCVSLSCCSLEVYMLYHLSHLQWAQVQAMQQVLGHHQQVEILKSQLATRFTRGNDYSADL